MSTRQRFTHETTTEPVIGAALLLPRTVDSGTLPIEDIAARRLRELALRVSDGAMPAASVDDDGRLDEADAEFEPVSLATILALSREEPDEDDDAPTDAAETVETLVPVAVVTSAPFPPVANDDDAGPPPALATLEVIDEPAHLEGEVLEATVDIQPTFTPGDSPAEASISDEDAQSAADQPLMLADQSAPDLRLVDLIRRQQSLLDQLNSFPPSYEALDKAAKEAPVEETEEPAPQSVVEQLAPAPAPAPTFASPKIAHETPPPLPPFEVPALPPPRLPKSAARDLKLTVRDHREEPPEAELPQQSPIIIQRARAERSGRRIGPAVAAPPSALPAFVGGLALALVVAGVLFAVL